MDTVIKLSMFLLSCEMLKECQTLVIMDVNYKIAIQGVANFFPTLLPHNWHSRGGELMPLPKHLKVP